MPSLDGRGEVLQGVVREGEVVLKEGGELALSAGVALNAVVLEGSERETTFGRL